MAPPLLRGPLSAAAAPVPASTAPAERPRLELVGAARRFRPGIVGTLVIALTFGTLFLLAAMQAVLVQGQLRLDRANDAIAERQETIDKLGTQVATLEAPDRIQRAAAEFGMVQPPDVVFLAPTTVDPLTAEPAPAMDGSE